MRRSQSRSLRFKLTAWFVLCFFAVEAAIFGGVVFLSRGVIQSTLDAQLLASAERMIENLLAAEAELTEDEVVALVPARSAFALWAIRDDQGAILVQWNVADASALPFSDWELVPTGPLGDVITPLDADEARRLSGVATPLRIQTIPFRYRDALYFFQVAERDPVLDRWFGPYFDLVVVGVPIGLVCTMIAAWLIAGRAVAPIRKLSKAAESLSPESLGERIDVSARDPEIARLQAELNFALERLEAGYAAQGQFISNVSHELKTPIAILLTDAQVARIGTPTRDQALEFVAKTEREMERLGELVENILTLARADLLDERRSVPVSIDDVVLETVQGCQQLAREAGVHLVPTLPEDPEIEPVVLGEAGLLRTMTENLVRNAIAHSPPDGEVRVDVRLAAPEISIHVSDRGPGVPDELKDAVFERFVQAPGTRSRGGSGLGLSIATRVARMHGGSIRAMDREGGGATFEVRLPLEHARGFRGNGASAPAPRASGG